MRSVPLHVYCLGPVHRLACFGGGGAVPFPPCLALGPAPPRGQACASGAVRHWGGRPCAASPKGVVGRP